MPAALKPRLIIGGLRDLKAHPELEVPGFHQGLTAFDLHECLVVARTSLCSFMDAGFQCWTVLIYEYMKACQCNHVLVRSNLRCVRHFTPHDGYSHLGCPHVDSFPQVSTRFALPPLSKIIFNALPVWARSCLIDL